MTQMTDNDQWANNHFLKLNGLYKSNAIFMYLYDRIIYINLYFLSFHCIECVDRYLIVYIFIVRNLGGCCV